MKDKEFEGRRKKDKEKKQIEKYRKNLKTQ